MSPYDDPEVEYEKPEFEESRFIADTGMVVVRTEGRELFLGLSVNGDPTESPDTCIRLTHRQAKALMTELEFYWLGEKKG